MHHPLALRALIAGTVLATTVAVCEPATATVAPTVALTAAPTTMRAAGCAPTVELQSMQFPTSAGPRRSVSALTPDDGGALAPTARVVERRTGDSDELVLVIGSGADVAVRRLYVAPQGCVIAWSHDVTPTAAAEGHRTVRTPAFTVRLVSVTTPDCPECMRAV